MSKPPVTSSPPRGRPEMSLEKRDEMRKQISQVAERLIKDEGYAKVSMRKIAKEIGCTPMTLYSYYGSKIEILQSLWGGVFDDLFKLLRATPTAPEPKRYLQNLCTQYVQYWLTHSDYYRLVFMAEGVTQPDVRLFIDNPDIIAQYSLFLNAVTRLSPHSTEIETKAKLDFLLSTLHGIAHNKITISGYEWASIEDQIEYALRGLA